MRTLIVALIFAFLAVPQIGDAEFYKYKDPQTGALKFTDDITEVPPDQRPKVKTYESYTPPPEPEPEAETQSVTTTNPAEENAASGVDPALLQKAQQLDVRRLRLEKEFEQLEKERAALEKERQELTSKSTVEAELKRRSFNARAQRLRSRIQAYDQKRQAFQKEVNALNRRMSEQQEAATQ
jgi:hypothetical protein